MKKISLYMLMQTLGRIQEILSRGTSVNVMELNKELTALYQSYNRPERLGTSEQEVLRLEFKTITAQLEVLRIRSSAYEQLNDLLFPF